MPNSFVLLTGASEGIGRTFATALAAEGRNIVAVARNQHRLASLKEELQTAYGIEVYTVVQDLCAPDAVEAVARACDGLSINMLINNAGFEVPIGPFEHNEPSTLHDMLQLNIVALTQLTHRFLRAIIASHGTIVNVASHAAFQPVPYMSTYAASKSYVLHFSEALSVELADRYPGQVHIMALCPGATRTLFWERSGSRVEDTRFSVMAPERVVDIAMRAIRRRKKIVVIPSALLSIATQFLRVSSRRANTFIAKKLVGY